MADCKTLHVAETSGSSVAMGGDITLTMPESEDTLRTSLPSTGEVETWGPLETHGPPVQLNPSAPSSLSDLSQMTEKDSHH